MYKFFLILFFIFSAAVNAAESSDLYLFASKHQEDRFVDLTHQFRCLVCQNQTLADSNAPLAVDMKKQILKMINQGINDQEITQFLTQRYGNFISYQPPFDQTTLLLWVGPFGLLVASMIFLFRKLFGGLRD